MLNVSKRAELGPNPAFANEESAASSVRAEANWYAIWTKSNFEQRTTRELADKGFDTYLPGFNRARKWKDRTKTIFTPIFPGYLFARFSDNAETRAHVLRTAGVVSLLGVGHTLEHVPEAELEAVKRLTLSPNGCSAHPFLTDGCHVRVRRGPLVGLEGIFVRSRQSGDSRLVIRVNLLGQAIATELDAADVDPVRPSYS